MVGVRGPAQPLAPILTRKGGAGCTVSGRERFGVKEAERPFSSNLSLSGGGGCAHLVRPPASEPTPPKRKPSRGAAGPLAFLALWG